MLSDGAKIALATKVLRRKYTGDKLTSGALENGKVYRIDKFKSGDDFSNIGADNSDSAPKGEDHRIFSATGTNPATWTSGSILRELNLAGLKAYADLVFAAASRTVTITNAGFEGGSGSGEITFEKAILSLAIENLIEEFDPDFDPGATESDGVVLEFGP